MKMFVGGNILADTSRLYTVAYCIEKISILKKVVTQTFFTQRNFIFISSDLERYDKFVHKDRQPLFFLQCQED